MAQTNYTPIQIYYSTTAAAVPVNTNLLNGELAINITDGKLYYKDNSGTVQIIATKGAGTIGGLTTQVQYNLSGALAGSANLTFNGTTLTANTLNLTNALGTIYGGTGLTSYTTGDLLYSSASNTLAKLSIGTANYILTVNSGGTNVQWSAPSAISVSTATNLAGGVAGSVPYQSGASTTTFLGIGAADRVMTSSGTAPQWVTALTGLTGVSSSSITNTGLTSGRVVYSSTGGLQTNSANLTFDGTTLTTAGLSNSGTSALVKLVTVGGTSFTGTTAFVPATPAKFYLSTGTVTDNTTGAGGTQTYGAIMSLGITPIAATLAGVTYTNAATLYIDGAPSNGANVLITNPYALYVAAGTSYFADNVGIGTSNPTQKLTVNGVVASIGPATALTASSFFIDYNTSTNTGRIAAVGNTTGTAAPMVFSQYSSNASVARDAMTLDASGNLGIGTTTPAYKLDVAGTLNVVNGSNGRINIGKTTNYFYGDSSNNIIIGNSGGDRVQIDSSGTLTVPGNIRGFQSTSLQLLANQYTDIVYAGAGGYGTLISGILTVYSTYSGAITQNSYFCNAVGNGIAGNGISMLANGDYSTASNLILYSRGAVLGGGSYVISVYNASGNTVGITYSFTPVGQGNGAAYYNSLTNTGSAGAGTGLPSGVSVVFGQNNAQVKASGVTFPATQAASADANTLDDYEEGTWTPTAGSGLTVTGTFVASGTYTKIGRLVTVNFSIQGTLLTCINGTQLIAGLPFSHATDSIGSNGVLVNSVPNTTYGLNVYGSSVVLVNANSNLSSTNAYGSFTYPT